MKWEKKNKRILKKSSKLMNYDNYYNKNESWEENNKKGLIKEINKLEESMKD